MNMTAIAEPGHTAVVMAAQRSHKGDPLDHRSGGGNKNFLPLAGRPMICWVLEALLESPGISEVIVSVENPALIDDLAEFAEHRESRRLRVVYACTNIVDSLEAALAVRADPWRPVIVTAGDNPLLTPQMVNHFLTEVQRGDLQAAIAMTPAEVMRARYPDGQRRFYRFADGEFSNCNLYAIVSPEAMGATEMFRGGGQFRKNALRMLRAFGVVNVLLYRLGRLRLADFGVRLSRAFGVRLGFVGMPFAEACIDVDNERTFRIAGEILVARTHDAAANGEQDQVAVLAR